MAPSATGGVAPGSSYCEGGAEGTRFDYTSELMKENAGPRSQGFMPGCLGAGCRYAVRRVPFSFGGFVSANAYLPVGATGPLPVVQHCYFGTPCAASLAGVRLRTSNYVDLAWPSCADPNTSVPRA